MRILVACEESQRVTQAFRNLGHEAYSADILPTSGEHPEWHYQGDALELLNDTWDMLIAFPPCTYLSNAGAVHLYGGGKFNEARFAKGLEAKAFFMAFYNAPIERIAIENPVPSKVYELPERSQIIQPYQFGHPTTKRTCLWLKNLPPLQPTNIVEPTQTTKTIGNWFNAGGKQRQINRSKTFEGIALAMAQQWGDL